MKRLIVFLMGLTLVAACTPDKSSNSSEDKMSNKNPVAAVADPTKGIGQVKNVALHTPLEQERIGRGKAIYEMKCSACHKLDDQRVVGPGWKNVTKNRKPEWIMNMITNVDVMLDKDPEAQKLLELCLMRMPNQNVSIGDARDILEFMRQNDGEQ
ncbi:MAG: c-type cytochrome [Cyclobacteriaceae bacterium]|jgi:mono/diheme cytochrome c family protein|nr:c-type cytochrome [Cyclobacteriaceae bacterium]